MKKLFKILFSIIIVLVVIGIVVIILYCPYAGPYSLNKETFDISEKEITDDITIMSYNIRYFAFNDFFKKTWFYRANLVLAVIAEQQPDVIGFQEVQPIHEKFLKEHLKGYEFIVAYRTGGPNREGAMIAYRKDRFTSEKQGMFWLSETPEVKSKDWGSSIYRVAVYSQLKDSKTGKTVTALDTHLDNASEEARREGIRVIIEQVEARGLQNPILFGDMNDWEESLMYEMAMDSGYLDALKIADTSYVGSGATYQDYGKDLDHKRIDYFFVKDTVHINSYKVIDKTFDGVYPSDHFPIGINLNL